PRWPGKATGAFKLNSRWGLPLESGRRREGLCEEADPHRRVRSAPGDQCRHLLSPEAEVTGGVVGGVDARGGDGGIGRRRVTVGLLVAHERRGGRPGRGGAVATR